MFVRAGQCQESFRHEAEKNVRRGHEEDRWRDAGDPVPDGVRRPEASGVVATVGLESTTSAL